MKIDLDIPKEITMVEKKTKLISSLTITRIVDNTNKKNVIVFLEEFNEPVILWENEDYIKIGQWTDEDVEKQLKKIF